MHVQVSDDTIDSCRQGSGKAFIKQHAYAACVYIQDGSAHALPLRHSSSVPSQADGGDGPKIVPFPLSAFRKVAVVLPDANLRDVRDEEISVGRRSIHALTVHAARTHRALYLQERHRAG
jgi:hypothetical protein